MSLKECYSALEDMQNKSGSYWIKRQHNLYYAIKNKKGRFAEISETARVKMMEDIEINVFGVSKILEQRKQYFLMWFRNTFGRNYNKI